MRAPPHLGILMLVCTETGGEVSSGAVYRLDDLARARRAKLLDHCRHCGETHLFMFSDARLAPIYLAKEHVRSAREH